MWRKKVTSFYQFHHQHHLMALDDYRIVVERVKINGNDNGIEISKVGRGRHFPPPDEGPEK
jgi:hypothetical protein